MADLHFSNLTDEQRKTLMRARTAFPEFTFTEEPDGGVILSGPIQAFLQLSTRSGCSTTCPPTTSDTVDEMPDRLISTPPCAGLLCPSVPLEFWRWRLLSAVPHPALAPQPVVPPTLAELNAARLAAVLEDPDGDCNAVKHPEHARIPCRLCPFCGPADVIRPRKKLSTC